MEATPVIVNVYDLAEFNSWVNWCKLGAYHTGVQVHGREFAFGAHPYDFSGIFDTEPLEAPGEVKFNCSVHVGDTYYTSEEVEDLIIHMGREYLGLRYHLLQTNCNTFTSDLCFALCGQRPPTWINRLANVALAVHCLCPASLLPPLQSSSMCPYGDTDLPRAPDRASLATRAAPSIMDVIGDDEIRQLSCQIQTRYEGRSGFARSPVTDAGLRLECPPRSNSSRGMAQVISSTPKLDSTRREDVPMNPPEGRKGTSRRTKSPLRSGNVVLNSTRVPNVVPGPGQD